METTVGAVDRRFLVTAFLPVAVFLALVAVTVRPPAEWHVAEGIALVVVALLVAALLAAMTGTLIRAYEGYWPGRLGAAVGALGRRHHRKVLTGLGARGDPAAYARIENGYPFPSDLGQVMPTTLGNVLRNAELHPRYRYGLDAVLVWPRLFLLAPDRALAGLAAARADLELQLTVSALSLLYGLVAGVSAIAQGRAWWAFALLFAGPMAAAWLSYVAAVAAARTYATQLKAVFDLYRLDLLERLAADLPGAEEDRWHRLQELWYRAVPIEAAELPPPSPMAEVTGPRSGMRLSGWYALGVLAGTLAGVLLLAVRPG